MHRLLSIAEMLDHIMGFAGNGTLANAAAVHSSWSNICLDKLWYQMDKLAPLMLLLGPVCNEPQLEANRGTDKVVPETLPVPDEQAWHHFHAYARRIRDLKLCRLDKPHALHLINGFSHSGDSLLPNLKRLEWSSSSSISLEYVVSFIGPSIESLSLWIGEIHSYPISDLYSILDLIGSRVPNLQSVKFSIEDPGIEYRGDLQDSVTALLLKCPKLKDIQVEAAWFDMIYFITGCRLWELPALNSIASKCHYPWLSGDWSQHHTTEVQACFPVLTELSLCANYDEMSKLLQHSSIAAERLKSVHFDSMSAGQPPESIITVTRIMPHCQSLTNVYFRVGRWRGPNGGIVVATMPFEVFDPLFLCPNITSLSISYRYGIAYSSDTFDKIVSAWPLLKVLSISSELIKDIRGTSDAHQNPTFATLVLLAEGLRSLEALKLSVDFIANTTPASPYIPTPSPTPFHMLDLFDVASSRSVDKQETARLLCTVIPPDCYLKYREYYTQWEDEYPGRDDWPEVLNLMSFGKHKRKLGNDL